MPTIADLPIGAKLKFGAYSVSGEMPHKICWVKAHRDGTVLTEFMEDQCAFDAKEPENPDEYRRSYGNNRYSQSNAHQFLNAEGTDWFRPTHEYDTAPEDRLMYNGRHGYVQKPGFLHYFDEWEVEAIEESEIKTALPTKDIPTGGEKHETIYAKVFMPSRTNVGGGTENRIQEGEVWDLFANGANRACLFSPELYANTHNNDKPEYEDEEWYYYLRSPISGHSCYVHCVGRGGVICYAYAYDDYLGVRPALKLNPEIPISDEPDGDGYYEVLSAPQEIIEIDEEEFFAILKKM